MNEKLGEFFRNLMESRAELLEEEDDPEETIFLTLTGREAGVVSLALALLKFGDPDEKMRQMVEDLAQKLMDVIREQKDVGE